MSGSDEMQGERWVSLSDSVCLNGRPAECGANLSPPATVGYEVFPGSSDGEVGKREIPAIPLASTHHMNSYF